MNLFSKLLQLLLLKSPRKPQEAYMKCCACRNGVSGYVAWAGFQPLSTDSAVTEPSDPVHFVFRPTEQEAIAALTHEMETEYGVARFIRQN